MKTNPKKRAQNKDMKSIEQQIKHCEERIAKLEEHRRNNPGQDDRSLDETYQQITLLKIRKMMDY